MYIGIRIIYEQLLYALPTNYRLQSFTDNLSQEFSTEYPLSVYDYSYGFDRYEIIHVALRVVGICICICLDVGLDGLDFTPERIVTRFYSVYFVYCPNYRRMRRERHVNVATARQYRVTIMYIYVYSSKDLGLIWIQPPHHVQ